MRIWAPTGVNPSCACVVPTDGASDPLLSAVRLSCSGSRRDSAVASDRAVVLWSGLVVAVVLVREDVGFLIVHRCLGGALAVHAVVRPVRRQALVVRHRDGAALKLPPVLQADEAPCSAHTTFLDENFGWQNDHPKVKT